MGEEPAGCQLVRQKVPPEELQSLVPEALSTDNCVSTSHGDQDNDDYNINSTVPATTRKRETWKAENLTSFDRYSSFRMKKSRPSSRKSRSSKLATNSSKIN